MKNSIELTEQEANVLINLINISVQAKGLEVAESAVYLLKKIKEAFEVKPEPVKE